MTQDNAPTPYQDADAEDLEASRLITVMLAEYVKLASGRSAVWGMELNLGWWFTLLIMHAMEAMREMCGGKLHEVYVENIRAMVMHAEAGHPLYRTSRTATHEEPERMQ